MEVLRVVVSMVMGITLPLVVILRDRRRLDKMQRRRSWTGATFAGALYAFGPLAMLGWSWVTRKRWWRCVWGPLWTGVLVLAMSLIHLLLPQADGSLPPEDDLWTTLGWVPLAVFGGTSALLLLMETMASLWRRLRAPRRTSARAALAIFAHLGLLLLASPPLLASPRQVNMPSRAALPPGPDGWARHGQRVVRGITVGPIENALHAEAGYGTARGRAALEEAAALGANWVAITPFGRVWDLEARGVDLTFEAPHEKNTRDVLKAIADAHRAGLRVFLVPHLWVETGGWRALINPPTEAGWKRWISSYRRFLLHWADVATAGQVELLSVGVELRSWVTGRHAPAFSELIQEVRARYPGLLTYSANWDDAESTVIWGELDLIGVNAFFPLTKRPNATLAELSAGGRQVASKLQRLAHLWQRPVLLTEMGYTTRVDPALKPWEWPDAMTNVQIDELAQARAYHALLAPLRKHDWCAGFFVWRTYADPGDTSQEAEWGFSPRGKLAELVVRDAFLARWQADPFGLWGSWAGLSWQGAGRAHPSRFGGQRARTPGLYRWHWSPSTGR